MSRTVRGTTRVAAVVGHPVAHSLSPILHNAWLEAADIDGVYVALDIAEGGFRHVVEGLRTTSLAGVNVTLPFKEDALAVATEVHPRARRALAANLLIFGPDGAVTADNTDGLGLLAALAEQAPQFEAAAGPVVVLGAGGAARGAVGALLDAGCTDVRIVNRTFARAQALAADLGSRAFAAAEAEAAFVGAGAVINATSAGLANSGALNAPLAATPASCVVMDMVYKPLITPFLAQAQALGRPIVDGLAMLIGQARPSFEALFGQPPPAGVDVRALALKALNP
ncbi:shikimate dehydrogenase [Phenylobacterium sp.]|jgi:shikimate dehydrogenase|uniref:shikimate dehydrogenase family protein n=1 Tax=Phenylobacterium sp. TaxID=1871053 RepID=UPI002E329C29|nr:shikimate dehydrogenase [Phenylobacterium sp.]HEX3366270.1 shikimate dehydrogenase [Phenylobacterium sp.]